MWKRPALFFALCATLATVSACRQPDATVVSADAAARRAKWTDPAQLASSAAAVADPEGVLAVLFDEPLAGYYSTLAVFADGGAQLLTSNGNGLFLETSALPESVRRAAAALCARATTLKTSFFDDAGRWPTRGRVRVTIVTRDGVFSREEMQNAILEKTSDLSPLSDGFLAIMGELLQINRVEARRSK